MGKYSKAIAAFLTSAVALGAQLGIDAAWASPENITGAALVLSTVLVWLVPNSE